MKRRDFQELAAIRLKEAQVLFDAGCYDGAYYLAGYVVEFALKACIARQTERFEFPDKKRVDRSHTHKFVDLVDVAGLTDALAANVNRSPELRDNWGRVREWSEQARYERCSKEDAESLLKAVRDRRHGILRWFKGHW